MVVTAIPATHYTVSIENPVKCFVRNIVFQLPLVVTTGTSQHWLISTAAVLSGSHGDNQVELKHDALIAAIKMQFVQRTTPHTQFHPRPGHSFILNNSVYFNVRPILGAIPQLKA